MIYTLTLSLWLFAHLDDIAANVLGWLFTPFSYGGRHRKAWRWTSSFDEGVDAVRAQGYAVADHYREEQAAAKAIVARVDPAPLCPPMYPAFSLPPERPSYVDDVTVLPRRTLAPGWRRGSGEIPVTQLGAAREMAEVT